MAPIIAKEFMVRGDPWKAEELSNNSKRVIPNFIRVDADEITYPLHIILRYKLEKALMRGDLSVPDLPDAWNEAFESSFGTRPSDDLQGCLQIYTGMTEHLVTSLPILLVLWLLLNYSLPLEKTTQIYWHKFQRDIFLHC